MTTHEQPLELPAPTERTGTEEESESYKYPDASVLLPIKIIQDTLTVIDSGVYPDLAPALVLSLARAFADVTTWLLSDFEWAMLTGKPALAAQDE